MLQALQQTRNISYLFISHDIAVISYIAHQVAVMYLGRIVEIGNVNDILLAPKHPYTQLLLNSVATLKTKKISIPIVRGEQPSAANPPSGCHFHPRCPHAMPICKKQYPPATKMTNKRRVHCWLYE